MSWKSLGCRVMHFEAQALQTCKATSDAGPGHRALPGFLLGFQLGHP